MSDTLKTLILVLLWSTLVGWFAFQAGQEDAETDLVLYKKLQAERIQSLEKENRARLHEANGRIALLTEDLNQTKDEYEKKLSSIEHTYSVRLLDSTKRADIYRSRAAGSEADREYLSAHAARLDKALEEGRRVVEELRSTVEQREYELRLIGKWFNENENVNGK